ncbi:MAG: hypothetical protein LUE29_10110 [Lachnospiraceae bacterium]|nr:hypothetical protein [Lachnospiraceae bacterium]
MQVDSFHQKFSTESFADSNIQYVRIGRISSDIVNFLKEKSPSLASVLSSETDIVFWKDRLLHTERHKNDFMSDTAYLNALESIPDIIQNPDYLAIHPKDSSISFIKDFSDHIAVVVRISVTGKLSYRTMYPLMDAQLTNYLEKGRAWKWTNKLSD